MTSATNPPPQNDTGASTIATERLLLVPMTMPFLQAGINDDLATASALLGATVPQMWLAAQPFMALRLPQLRRDPTLLPWLLRAIVLRQEQIMIGHIGCHDRPGAAYLQPYAPNGVEFGYTIFAPYRRQGYAREALAGLMAWAQAEQGITQFVLSISPQNEPSRRIAQHFGFVQQGTIEDDEDGPEDIFVLTVSGQ